MGIQQFGFLLGSCGVKVALTTENCLKGLPKLSGSSFSSSNTASHSTTNYSTTTSGSGGSNDLTATSTSIGTSSQQAHGDVIDFKGWPRLNWIVTENLNRPSRDFTLPINSTPKDTAYIEYSTDVEGTVKGVCVSREAMMTHAKALTSAMQYKEGTLDYLFTDCDIF